LTLGRSLSEIGWSNEGIALGQHVPLLVGENILN